MNARMGCIAVLWGCVSVSHAHAADEACGQMIVVSYRGAVSASPQITRTKPEAKARADALLKEVAQGDQRDFAAIAKAQSDAPGSAPRGGVMGTYERGEWPELHAALKAPLFKLKEGQVAKQPIDAPYGYVLLRRCKVEKAHARHLLIRYAGAKNAKPEITRTREQARQLAQKLLADIHSEKDFLDAIARSSEDSSRDRGGDIGSPGRGRLAQAFEEALFALQIGQRSGVVETEFGFHIIERLPL